MSSKKGYQCIFYLNWGIIRFWNWQLWYAPFFFFFSKKSRNCCNVFSHTLEECVSGFITEITSNGRSVQTLLIQAFFYAWSLDYQPGCQLVTIVQKQQFLVPQHQPGNKVKKPWKGSVILYTATFHLMLISAVTNKVGGSLFLLAAGINYQLLLLWRQKEKKSILNIKQPWCHEQDDRSLWRLYFIFRTLLVKSTMTLRFIHYFHNGSIHTKFDYWP